jgi:similar to stage IV sporulation protein
MERLSDRLRGYAVIKVTGACPESVLNICAEKSLEFWRPEPTGEFTIVFRCRLDCADEIASFAKKSCCDIEITERRGAPLLTKRLRYRPVLWVLPLALCILLLLASLFVWRIEIIGNETVTDTEILNALEDSGIYIGSFWPSYSSDIIRSRVIMQIPELKWVGVSVFGSRVRIQVREATEKPELFDTDAPVKIVASRAGIIERLSVLRGYPIFVNGQTAVDGDKLIDGVVPSSFGQPRIVHASGSVLARTWYEISAVMPLTYSEKIYSGREYRQYFLVLGKHRINFYRSSRIISGDCDIIIEEHRAGIRGLFTLPVTFVRERALKYEIVEHSFTENEIKEALQRALEGALRHSVGKDGEIVEQHIAFSSAGGYAVATLRAECVQDIAEDEELTQFEIDAAKAADEEETDTR